MKRTLLFLAFVAMWQSAFAYYFSAVAPSGQSLYFNMGTGGVTVTYPGLSSNQPYASSGYKPTGALVIPDSVVNSSTGIKYAVTSIGLAAFYSCSGLTSVTIPNSITSIGSDAFYNCTGLTTVYFNADSCISTSTGTFHGCSNLVFFIFGNNVKRIPSYLFYDRPTLTTITIPNSVTTIGNCAFLYCRGLTSVTIPNSVTSIEGNAFANCSGLTSVTIGNSVTSIGNRAFSYCSGLTSVTIPNSVTSIGNEAFYDCSGLTSVTIGNSVTSIGSFAFSNCTGLNKITVHRAIPPNLSSSSFNGVSSIIQLEVPCGSTSAFSSSSYWSRFNNITEYVLNPAYTLTLESANTARGSVDMDCSNQDSILVVATPSYGYHFDHWNDGNVDNPRVLTSLECDSTLTAYFANNTYAITTENRNISSNGYGFNSDFQNILMDNVWTLQNGNYTNRWVIGDVGGTRCLFISSNGTSNTYNTSYGSATFAYTIISLTAGALTYSYDWRCNGESGYDYLRVALVPDNIALNASAWGNSLPSGAIALDGGTQLRGQSTWQTKTGTANITSTGLYKLVFFWKNDGSDGNNPPAAVDNILLGNGNQNPTEEVCGTIQGGGNAQYLDTMTLTAIADHYYHFVQWQDGNTENPRQIIVTQDAVYTAFFEGDPYPVDLQVNDSTRGTVSGAGSFPYHTYTTIRATPFTGYTFVRWSDNDSNSVRQIFITGNISMTAYFEPMLFTISGDANPSEYGSVIGGGIASYLDTVTLVASPNYGYRFIQWGDRNIENPRHVVVSSDATYIAYFEKDQFSIAVSADDPSHGIVSGGGVFDYLSNRTIRANAENGYHFSHWNDGNTDNPRMVTLVQDTSFVAYFAPNQYTITVSSADESLGTASGGGTYFYGDTITLSATATAEHYHFSRWSDYSWGNPREYVVTGDRTIVAYFAIDVHSVSVASNDIARGMVEASGTLFEYGQPCTVTATAYSGYTFHSWSNGMTDNPYTFAVLSDVELTANFIAAGEQVYTITVQSADPTMGTVSGGGQALRGGTLTIRAQGNAGYRFLRWQDNNTDSVRTVTVTGNATYTAYFSETVGIEDVEGYDQSGPRLYPNPAHSSVTVTGLEPGRRIALVDLYGRTLADLHASSTELTIDVSALSPGTYFVRVEGLPTQKVVVIN